MGWLALEAEMPCDSFPQLTAAALFDSDRRQQLEAEIKQSRAEYFLASLPEQAKRLVEHAEWRLCPNDHGRMIYKLYGPYDNDPRDLAPDQMLIEVDGAGSLSARPIYGKISITHQGIELTINVVPHHEDSSKRLTVSFLQGPHGLNDQAAIKKTIDALNLPQEIKVALDFN